MAPGTKKPTAAQQKKAAKEEAAKRSEDGGAGGSDSDDDAPEEITVAKGKALASNKRGQELSQAQAEQAGRKEVAASRREQEQRRKEQRDELEEEAPASASGRKQGGPASAKPGRGKRGREEGDLDAGVDLLPESVTTGLALQRRQRAEDARLQQAAAVAAALQQDRLQQAINRKRTPLVAVQKGPVTVTVLKEANLRAVGSGSNFLHEQLYSGRVVRSRSMLRGPAPGSASEARAMLARPAAHFA